MTVRDRCLAPFASGRPAAQASHLRSCAGLVNEDEFCRIKIELAFEPSLSCGLYVAALLFGRVRRLFCT